MNTTFYNVTVLTLDPSRRIIPDGCLVIADDRIEAVGTRAELGTRVTQGDKAIDGHGMVAMPGLVNAHTHSFQSLLRGLADGLELISFLRDVIYPVSAVITPEETRLGAALTVLEAIKSGTTCLVDNHSANTCLAATEAIAQVLDASGIRGMVARGLREQTARARLWHVPEHSFRFTWKEEIAITQDLMERWVGKATERVQVCPAPLTLFLVTPEGLRSAKALANEYKMPLHVHVAETQSEVNATLEDYGCREVEHLERAGVLDQRTHVVHGVWLDTLEREYLAEAGAHVIHCPTSNMNLASGVAPIPDLLAQGVNVALGSDGIGNHNQDMFSVMKAASLMQRVHTLRPDVLSPARVLEMATLGGARALGLEKDIGSLEAGKKADVILLDLRKPHTVPLYNLPTAIVFGAGPADVDTVMVDGRMIMEGRQVKTLDEAAIITDVERTGPELLRRAGLNV